MKRSQLLPVLAVLLVSAAISQAKYLPDYLEHDCIHRDCSYIDHNPYAVRGFDPSDENEVYIRFPRKYAVGDERGEIQICRGGNCFAIRSTIPGEYEPFYHHHYPHDPTGFYHSMEADEPRDIRLPKRSNPVQSKIRELRKQIRS